MISQPEPSMKSELFLLGIRHLFSLGAGGAAAAGFFTGKTFEDALGVVFLVVAVGLSVFDKVQRRT